MAHKRARTSEDTNDSDQGRLLFASLELQGRFGQKYCQEYELLPLLLAHGFVRRVRTIEIDVRPLGGDSFKVTLDASNTSVGDLKKEIARMQGTPQNRQELYKVAICADGAGGAVREDDAEPEALDNELRQLVNREVVALAVKEEPLVWRTCCAEDVTLSNGGTVAIKYGPTNTYRAGYTLVTSGTQLTSGRHYWEVVLLNKDDIPAICIGISSPDLDPTGFYGTEESTDGWFVAVGSGTLCGNGMSSDGWMTANIRGTADGYQQGDHVGVLLDLDEGSLRFFKNGVLNGASYPPGSVHGPVVHALQMYYSGSRQQLLAASTWPAGYGPKQGGSAPPTPTGKSAWGK
jgi:hypothetical protein